MNDGRDTKLRATGLWRNESKNGVVYWSGSMGAIRVLVFKNDRGEGENAPEFQMYFTQNAKPGERDGQPREAGDNADNREPAAPSRPQAPRAAPPSAPAPQRHPQAREGARYPLTGGAAPARTEPAPAPRPQARAAAPAPQAHAFDANTPGVPQKPLGIDEADIPF